MIGLIGITTFIIMLLVIFSLVLGNSLFGTTQSLTIDNTALVNGTTTTYAYPTETFLFYINIDALVIAGIIVLSVIIGIALVAGANLLSSGLNPQGTRFVVFLMGYIGFWVAVSVLAIQLIISIALFGSLIYVILTIGYVIGVIQKISEG